MVATLASTAYRFRPAGFDTALVDGETAYFFRLKSGQVMQATADALFTAKALSWLDPKLTAVRGYERVRLVNNLLRACEKEGPFDTSELWHTWPNAREETPAAILYHPGESIGDIDCVTDDEEVEEL